jgi:phosphoribosylanthranilate isomerase
MKRPVNIPFFIAGGLNPTNVHDVLRTCKPHGVDVSSGVEDSKSGKKDLFLIREFIDIVKRGKNDN